MKDLEFFLSEESAYGMNCPKEPDWIMKEDGHFEFADGAPLDFLCREHFKKLAKDGSNSNIDSRYGLSPVEIVMLRCFMADISYAFRPDYYPSEVPSIAKEMMEVLDSVIKKAPICRENILYRRLNEYDSQNMELHSVFEPLHSLTTTIRQWENGADYYIIKTLTPSKAHELYKLCLYDVGDERQVNFERGTKFRIENIETIQSGYKRITMQELQV